MTRTIFLSLILAPSLLLAGSNESSDSYFQVNPKNADEDVELLYRKFWSLDSEGMPSFSEPNENFGSAVVNGNFNNDLFGDIAIGVPGYASNSGAVIIMYGNESGLSSNNSVLLFQSVLEQGGVFGYSLTSGDFNGDLIDDLVVGSPFKDVGNSVDAGVIKIFYGNNQSGLSDADSVEIDAGTGQKFPDLEADAKFGWSLAAGFFDDDPFEDLAVSMPNKTIAVGSPPVNVSNAGLVRVFNGSSTGINGADFNDIRQGTGGVSGAPESDDLFGYSLAVGDFDRTLSVLISGEPVDNYDDLVIGVPFESFNATNNGIVQIFQGGTNGLVYSGLLSQADTTDPIEDDDLFGFTLTTGDVNNILGPDDLIIGVPFEDVGTAENAGMVHVFYGSNTGLVTAENQTITQASAGIFGTPEQDDFFGLALTVGQFNRFAGGFNFSMNDLAIGAPNEDFLAINDGVVTVVPGSSSGLDTNNSIFLSNGSANNNTNYGLSLSTVRFSAQNSSFSSLIVGIPGQASDGNLSAGAIEEIGFDFNDIIFKNEFE